jgi:cellulose synthase/poly-beta-1,6-N-acetylglucosamine synthase-like glycosyltransferase
LSLRRHDFTPAQELSSVKFSLVVPTVGRPVDLQRFIDHLRLQRGPGLDLRELELIVVDQSGQPETGELLAQQQAEFRILHLPMAGRGASRARNYGWGFARGEIITFPDDDCHYPSGFLQQVLQKFDNPDIDAISARVEFMSRREVPAAVITRANVLDCCPEAGLFARREALGDLRFDELMGIGCESPWNSDEGPDLLLRMMARGLRIDYCPDLCIHHPNPLQTQDERLQERNYKYSRGRGYLLRKHQFPVLQIVKTMVRSLGGSLLMAATARPFWARYYWRSFVGKWQGLRGGKAAPKQLLTSPLVQESRRASFEHSE